MSINLQHPRHCVTESSAWLFRHRLNGKGNIDISASIRLRGHIQSRPEFHQYVNNTLKQANPSIDWSKRITSTTRFMTLQPGKVDSKVLEGLQPSWPELYFWRVLKMGGLPIGTTRSSFRGGQGHADSH